MRNFSAPGCSAIYAAKAAAATSHPLSTLAALEMLRIGGNAVDAGIAALAVQCVVDPLMTGIGGDCFALYTPKEASVPIALNGSGHAPAAAHDGWYLERGLSAIEPTSPHAVTVPGAIAAWARLVKDHGTRNLGDLLQPAIEYAENGYSAACSI
jgi:gamma-glutamyltranspeptidase / glutathione hydrolase